MSELTKEMIDAFFAQNLAGHRDEPQESEATPDDLRALYALMNVKHDFKPGDIVRLKPGLQGYKSAPGYGQPGIVMRAVDPPIVSQEKDDGRPSFGVSLDIVLGILMHGDFLEFYYDSRRFEPFLNE